MFGSIRLSHLITISLTLLAAFMNGCADKRSPAAHEPDRDPEEMHAQPPTRAPAPQPAPTAPPPAVSKNPLVVTRTERAPASPPPASTVDPLNVPEPDRRGAANLRPVEGPPAFPETPPPSETANPYPAGITVLEEERPGATTSVQMTVSSRDRVVIDTRNVKLMRLDRGRMNVAQDRRVALLVDGQGVEWTAGVETVFMDRSRNGDWSVARAPEP